MTKLLIYSFIVMTLIIISLFVVYKMVKDETKKDKILKIFAILTVIIHFSSLWVDYLTTGSAEVENTMLFPICPCNICMWLLLIVSFMKKKDSFIYKTIAEFLAIGGTLCGLIGLFANEIFLATPEFSNWDSLKGLLSHTTMIFGTLFLLTQGYVKIRAISLTISCTLGLLLFADQPANVFNGISMFLWTHIFYLVLIFGAITLITIFFRKKRFICKNKNIRYYRNTNYGILYF